MLTSDSRFEDRKTIMLDRTVRSRATARAQRVTDRRDAPVMACTSCETDLSPDAWYCGMCGRRARPGRCSLTGSIFAGLYRVEGALAEGGFAAIYRGTYLPTGMSVALKVLHADIAEDPRVVARFRREHRNLCRLRNCHTVAVYDYGETADGTHYIAMELLVGETLLQRMSTRGLLDWRTALPILGALCSSLAEAHAHGIVHRDLTPANIHLGANGNVKVLDFGLSKAPTDEEEDLTRPGHAVGTVHYMPPEQLSGAACDGRADLYALGVLAYEMLTGQRPFPEATTPATLLTAQLTESPPPMSTIRPLDEIPLEIDAIVLRCLARDPADRYEGVTALAVELERALARAAAPFPRNRLRPGTPAFELLPPRILIDKSPMPAFVGTVRGSIARIFEVPRLSDDLLSAAGETPARPIVSPPRRRWLEVAVACAAVGIALGAAVSTWM